MSLVFIHYPVLILLFMLSVIMIFSMRIPFIYPLIPAFLGILSTIALLIAGLYYSVPLLELLLFLLLLVFVHQLIFGKGASL